MSCSAPGAAALEMVDTSLPEPCRGTRYQHQMTARGGSGQLRWRLLSGPSWVEFDAETHTISGNTGEAGPLTVEVEDGCQLTRRSYTLTPRESCWFAYVSSGTGSYRLTLWDPILDPMSEHRILLPSAAGSTPVRDFKFSQDGQFLAYRHGDSLRIAKAPQWEDQSVDFGDSARVERYTWSPDGSVLAVAYTSSGATYLSGVDVTGARSNAANGGAGGASTVGTGLALLEPTFAPVQSELVWFQGQSVAFLSLPAEDPDYWYVHHATFRDGRFGTVAMINENYYRNDSAVRLRGTVDGVFAIQSPSPSQLGQTQVDFFAVGDVVQWYVHGEDMISPSGRYTGRANEGSLRVFPANEDSFMDEFAMASRDGCPALLAWAGAVERMACVADVPAGGGGGGAGGEGGANGGTQGRVSIFELDALSAELTRADMSGQYHYDQGIALGRRRALSADGRWFAFADDQYLYVANVESGSPSILQSYYSNLRGTDPIELAFSPGGHFLLQHQGTALWIHNLDVPDQPQMRATNQELASPLACQERFVDDPDHWCGNLENPGEFVWSRSSQLAAIKTATGTLQILNVSSWPPPEVIGVNDNCGTPCMGQFGFQP